MGIEKEIDWPLILASKLLKTDLLKAPWEKRMLKKQTDKHAGLGVRDIV
jgi:hypothetical protein